MSQSAPGVRSSRRRVSLDLTTVLAVLLPLLTVAALLLVRPDAAPADRRPPTRTALTSAAVVCPSALPGAATAHLGSVAEGAQGDVHVGAGGEDHPTRLTADRVTTVDEGEGPLTVTAEGDLAPGLLAARFGAGPLAAVSCSAPSPDRWFTGVGAGARHSSTRELVNPDSGPAVADVTLYAGGGIVDVPRLRGVSVPGHGSVRLDLGAIVPHRGELALHVLTSRGRLAASVLDTLDQLGAGHSSQDWVSAQPAPSTDNLLLGLAPGGGTRTLVLANAGADEVRASLKVVTEKSVFAPEGSQEIRIPPGGTQRVLLSDLLTSAIRDGAMGLEVQSTGPVTTTLRSFADGDVSHAVGGTPVRAGAAVLVPEGHKQLVLAGADAVGVATVVARSASGKVLARTRAELKPGRGSLVKLPDAAVLVSVVPERTAVTGAVVVSGTGTTVVPLTELVRNGLIPAMRPGLP